MDILDTRGMSCPMPLLKLSQKLKGMEIGQDVEIMSDDMGFEQDVYAWEKSTGHQLISLQKEQAYLKATIKKTH